MTSQLQRMCDRLGIRIESEYGKTAAPEPVGDDWRLRAHPYRVRLRFQRRSLTTDFWMGEAHTNEPTTADVLSCLISDASSADQPFENWASDLGYETDSRKAEATYRACAKLAPRVRAFLGDAFDQLARAKH